jgi:molybdopterin synthase sulfur carrier subunit
MDIKIILFGQLADIAGNNEILLKSVSCTRELQEQLKSQYPAVAASKYIIAVDKKMVQENTLLHENNLVALLPPFSGG